MSDQQQLSSLLAAAGIGSITATSASRLRGFSFTEKTMLVLDIGYCSTKAGFAGEAKPRWVIPTKCPKTNRSLMDIEDDVELTNSLLDFLHLLFTRFAICFARLYAKRLPLCHRHLLLSPKEKNICIAESLFIPVRIRSFLAKVLFTNLGVGSVYMAPSSIFSLVGLGWRSGLVVDIGYLETTVLPVFENIPIIRGVKSNCLGAKSVNAKLKEVIPGITDDEAILDEIKINHCFVERFDRRHSKEQVKTPAEFDLALAGLQTPMKIDGSVRSSVAEIFFPDEASDDSVSQLILDSLETCPIDARRYLAEHIVLVGGTACLPGFAARLCKELRKARPNQSFMVAKSQINVSPLHAAWFGASMFAGHDVMLQRTVTKDRFAAGGDVLPDWLLNLH